MAGMFYSLKETAEILGKTPDEVRQLADQGKLRVFRDGANLLFKIEEVHALLAESGAAPDLDLDVGELDEAVAAAPGEGFEEEESGPTLDDSLEQDIFQLDDELAALEPATEDEALAGLDLPVAAEDETPAAEEEPAPGEEEMASELGLAADEAEASSELDLRTEEADASSELALTADSGAEAGEPSGEEDIFLLDEEPLAGGSTTGTEEEISLAPESGLLAGESDITDMDTALTGESVSVLGESGSGYEVTDDSMAETAGPAGTDAEASLEEIEGDVNLDSFGSGSGLLDLSLQADDTSLGGILDEIYTSEGGEEEAAAVPAGVDEASFEEITAEAEHAAPDEGLALPEAVAVLPTAVSPVYAEAAPDAQSNLLGLLLFLPLLALLYTAIVVAAGLRNVMPSILESIQGLIWYILGGALAVSLLIVGASFVVGGEKAPKAAKPARDKKAKAEKPGKDRKVKAEKPAKEKKSFFGKKK